MPTFIGLDLAWTTKNESGICWLEGDSKENLRCTRLEVGPRETIGLAEEIASVEGPVVVTIDAPVRYTPERWAEREINRQFGRYKASAHSAHAAYNRGYTAGIDLGDALTARGFTTDPSDLLNGTRPDRSAIEVYPHTIHVRLFDLEERLPYKPRGSKRPVEFRQGAFHQYQRCLTSLLEREAPGVLDSADVRRLLASETVSQCGRHVELSWIDDALDGLTCAISAWMMWSRPDRWEALGDLNGYIVVPREHEAELLARHAPLRLRHLPPQRGGREDIGVVVQSEDGAVEPADPVVSVERDSDGVDVLIDTQQGGLRWEIRVRLEGDDLARVVTVVERME